MNIQEAAKIINVAPKDIRRMARKYYPTQKEKGKSWDLTLQQVTFIGSLFAGLKNKRPTPTEVRVSEVSPQTKGMEELTSFASDWLQEIYGLDLNIPIIRNNRLKRSLGRFRHYVNGQAVNIELSGELLTYHPKEEVIDVLKHELVHYALFTLGKPYKDGQQYFESELTRLGVGRTHTIQHRGKVHLYKCTACNKGSVNRRKLTLRKYQSICCKAPLEYEGEANR